MELTVKLLFITFAPYVLIVNYSAKSEYIALLYSLWSLGNIFSEHTAFVLDAMLFMAGMARSKYVQTLSSSKEEVTTTLSAGISINHLISIIIAIGGGLLWESLGIEVLFSMAALFGLGSFVFHCFCRERECPLV